jgi:hypothetical protein
MVKDPASYLQRAMEIVAALDLVAMDNPEDPEDFAAVDLDLRQSL